MSSRLLAFALAAAAIDAIALPLWAGSAPRPDLGVVVLALAAMPNRRGEAAVGRAFGAGIVKDLFSGLPLGLFALAGTGLAVLFAWHGRSFRMDHPLWRAGVCAAGAAAAALLGGGAAGAVLTAAAAGTGSFLSWIVARSSSSSPSC